MTKPKSAAKTGGKGNTKIAAPNLAPGAQKPESEMTASEKRAHRKAQRELLEAQNGNTGSTAVEEINNAAMQRPDAVSAAAGDLAKPSKSGEHVIVGCKLGVAYYDIQLQKRVMVQENTQTGPREVPKYERVGQVVRLRGTAYPRGQAPEGFPERPIIVDGAALTFNVDKAFWEEWADQNKLHPLVQNRMIFAHTDLGSVRAIAKEMKDQSSGMDPLNPKNDPRMPKSTRNEVTNIETESERTAKMDRAIAAQTAVMTGKQ